MVNWANYEHDGEVGQAFNGEESGSVSESLPGEYLQPDEEPTPVAIDSWARGVLQVRKAVPQDTMSFKSGSSGHYTPSVSSYKSTVYAKSARRSSIASNMTMKTLTAANGKAEQHAIIELGEDFEAVNLNSTGHMFDMLNKAVRDVSYWRYLSFKTSLFRGRFSSSKRRI